MKRALSLILLVLYAIMTIGVTWHTHYCMGRVKYVSLYAPKHCPPTCAKQCCRDEATTIRLADAHVQSQYATDISVPCVVQPALIADDYQGEKLGIGTQYAIISLPAPPIIWGNAPRFVQFGQLVYYA